MLQHWANSVNRPTATDGKKESMCMEYPLYFGLISLVGTTPGESINCCHQMSYFKVKMHQIRFRLGLSTPQAPLAEFKEAYF